MARVKLSVMMPFAMMMRLLHDCFPDTSGQAVPRSDDGFFLRNDDERLLQGMMAKVKLSIRMPFAMTIRGCLAVTIKEYFNF